MRRLLPAAHVKFGVLKAEADRAVLSARLHQAELWTELAHSKPSLSKLDAIGSVIEEAMTTAEDSFTHMLRLNPNSVMTLRRYSVFLSEVHSTHAA